MAAHMQHYLALLGIPFLRWSRSAGQSANQLRELIELSTHVLLLISDSAIETFYQQNPSLKSKSCVHFSGALVSPSIPSAHPLMTFSHPEQNGYYDLATYQKIPFVLEANRASGEELLPGLINPIYFIPSELKTHYHALCVMSGNFTTILWEKVFTDFEKILGLPREILFPYLQQTTSNLETSTQTKSVLTGPLVRGDQATILKHMKVLESDSFVEIYRSFVLNYIKTNNLDKKEMQDEVYLRFSKDEVGKSPNIDGHLL